MACGHRSGFSERATSLLAALRPHSPIFDKTPRFMHLSAFVSPHTNSINAPDANDPFSNPFSFNSCPQESEQRVEELCGTVSAQQEQMDDLEELARGRQEELLSLRGRLHQSMSDAATASAAAAAASAQATAHAEARAEEAGSPAGRTSLQRELERLRAEKARPLTSKRARSFLPSPGQRRFLCAPVISSALAHLRPAAQ